jgi:ribosome maturation factor RimP
VYIDKPGGVTHGDCEFMSHRLGELIDQEDAVPGESYTLEVSSPGVERKLSKPRDFERVVGQKVRLLLREPVESQVRWEGTLAGIADEILTMETQPGSLVQVPLEKVRKANLKFEW